MKKYQQLSDTYDSLERLVHLTLKTEIEESEIESIHMNDTKVIKVNVFDYEELAVINNELTFMDRNGYFYSLYNECSLEDLIDILNNI